MSSDDPFAEFPFPSTESSSSSAAGFSSPVLTSNAAAPFPASTFSPGSIEPSHPSPFEDLITSTAGASSADAIDPFSDSLNLSSHDQQLQREREQREREQREREQREREQREREQREQREREQREREQRERDQWEKLQREKEKEKEREREKEREKEKENKDADKDKPKIVYAPSTHMAKGVLNRLNQGSMSTLNAALARGGFGIPAFGKKPMDTAAKKKADEDEAAAAIAAKAEIMEEESHAPPTPAGGGDDDDDVEAHQLELFRLKITGGTSRPSQDKGTKTLSELKPAVAGKKQKASYGRWKPIFVFSGTVTTLPVRIRLRDGRIVWAPPFPDDDDEVSEADRARLLKLKEEEEARKKRQEEEKRRREAEEEAKRNQNAEEAKRHELEEEEKRKLEEAEIAARERRKQKEEERRRKEKEQKEREEHERQRAIEEEEREAKERDERRKRELLRQKQDEDEIILKEEERRRELEAYKKRLEEEEEERRRKEEEKKATEEKEREKRRESEQVDYEKKYTFSSAPSSPFTEITPSDDSTKSYQKIYSLPYGSILRQDGSWKLPVFGTVLLPTREFVYMDSSQGPLHPENVAPAVSMKHRRAKSSPLPLSADPEERHPPKGGTYLFDGTFLFSGLRSGILPNGNVAYVDNTYLSKEVYHTRIRAPSEKIQALIDNNTVKMLPDSSLLLSAKGTRMLPSNSVVYYDGKFRSQGILYLPEYSGVCLPKVRGPENTGKMELHEASRKGDSKLVRILLENYGFSPNLRDHALNTPLHLARDLDTATVLVRHGARLGLKNEKGKIAGLKFADSLRSAVQHYNGLPPPTKKKLSGMVDKTVRFQYKYVKQCFACAEPLKGLFVTKNYCQICGIKLCKECSRKSVKIQSLLEKVCDGCFNRVNTKNDEDEDVEIYPSLPTSPEGVKKKKGPKKTPKRLPTTGDEPVEDEPVEDDDPPLSPIGRKDKAVRDQLLNY